MSKVFDSKLRRSARIAAARGLSVKRSEDGCHLDQPLNAAPAVKRRKTVAPTRHRNILQLNDDCILKIFSYLSMNDLFAVSDVNDRLSFMAYLTAKKMFRAGEYVRLSTEGENHLESDMLMLFNFGKFITHLHIADMFPLIPLCNRKVGTNFVSMMNNCTELKCVRFEGISDPSDVTGFEMSLANIETLELEGIDTVDLVPLLKYAQKLKNIILENIELDMTSWMAIAQHESLESIRFRNVLGFGLGIEFLSQIRYLRHLRKLEYANFSHKITVWQINELAKLSWLDELNLECMATDECDFRAFSRLKNIESATVYVHTNRRMPGSAVASMNNFKIKHVKHKTLYASRMYAYTYTLVSNHYCDSTSK